MKLSLYVREGSVTSPPCLPGVLLGDCRNRSAGFHHLPIGGIHLWKSFRHLWSQVTPEVASWGLAALLRIFHTNKHVSGEAPDSSQTSDCCSLSQRKERKYVSRCSRAARASQELGGTDRFGTGICLDFIFSFFRWA